jgi:hypothetical protein
MHRGYPAVGNAGRVVAFERFVEEAEPVRPGAGGGGQPDAVVRVRGWRVHAGR